MGFQDEISKITGRHRYNEIEGGGHTHTHTHTGSQRALCASLCLSSPLTRSFRLDSMDNCVES